MAAMAQTRGRSQIQPSSYHRQRGVVLLLALVALLLIAAVAAAILFMASGESGVVGSQRLATRVYYSATGGLGEAQYRMMPALQTPGGAPADFGLNFTDTLNLTGIAGTPIGLPIVPCTTQALHGATEQAFTLIPCTTSTVAPPGAPRPWNVLYILNTSPGPGCNPAQPASPINDPTLCGPNGEIPFPNIVITASTQPGAGAAATSVPYDWVRINLKTERASGQDINFDGTTTGAAADDPIFYYQTRQYTLADLQGLGLQNAIPVPWGNGPLPNKAGKPCLSVICASPVYMITSFSQTAGATPGRRLVRAEVAAVPAFSLDGAINSQPGISALGGMSASGRDLCDRACDNLTPDLVGGPPNPDLIFGCTGPATCNPNYPNFDARASTTVPATCKFRFPIQSQAGGGAQNPGPNANRVDPLCTVCTAPGVPAGCNAGCVCNGPNTSCIMSGQAGYDVNDLIAMLQPMAERVLPASPPNYTGTAIGGFPFGDPVTGAGANPVITYVPGNMTWNSGTGAGILIVDGNLTMNPAGAFWGIIIVRGTADIRGVGNPPANLPCNIYGGIITGGGLTTGLNGSICFQYNSCAQQNQFSNIPFATLSFREIPR